MSVLIFFLVTLATAFAVIMNDGDGFENLGHAILTAAVMMMGVFDFKQTFLHNTNPEYDAFDMLRFILFVLFLVFVSVIIMNLLLALAIEDTSDEFKKKMKKKNRSNRESSNFY